MKLTRLEIENLKLVRKLELDFTRDGEPRPWTVLVGENGTCKTSILQAIGMAASGGTRANQLADASHYQDVRLHFENRIDAINNSLKIIGRFGLRPGIHGPHTPIAPPKLLNASLTSFPGTHSFFALSAFGDADNFAVETEEASRASQSVGHDMMNYIVHRQDFSRPPDPLAGDPLEAWRATNDPGALVLGYGISRMLPEPLASPRPDDLARERLEPLFGKRALLGTDFVEHLTRRNKDWGPAFDAELNRALLEVEQVVPRIGGIDLIRADGDTASQMLSDHRFTFKAGREGVKLPATWLSQGYQATIAWIADLIGHAFWDAKAPVKCEDIHALVLIDELDLHLHPRWQSGFVTALKRVFPNVQFIATTHSPMVLPGLEADEIVRLGFDDEGNVIAQHPDVTPATLTGSGLYERFFGVSHSTPDELAEKIRRLGLLVGDPGRSDAEDAEMKRLQAELRAAGVDPGWEPVPIDPALQEP